MITSNSVAIKKVAAKLTDQKFATAKEMVSNLKSKFLATKA